MEKIARGTPAFRRVAVAMLAGGVATFGLLYCPQALLPALSRAYAITPAQASLTVSVTTLALGCAMLVSAVISDRVGRKNVMIVSLLAAAVLGLGCALAPSFETLVVMRGLEGFALGGFPAIALSYAIEEIDSSSLGLITGMMVGGNGLGGMTGRLTTAFFAGEGAWRIGLGLVSVVAMLAALLLWRLLPPSRHFVMRRRALGQTFTAYRNVLGDVGLGMLNVAGFMFLGANMTMYNYLAYRLEAAPFFLSAQIAGWVYLMYVIGPFGSMFFGLLSDRLGRRGVTWMAALSMLVGALLTLAPSLPLTFAGVALLTFSFFGVASVLNAWVGIRGGDDRAHASSVYMCFYYAGGAVIGTLAGLIFHASGWTAVILVDALCILVGLTLSLIMIRVPTAAARAAQRAGGTARA